MDQDHSSTPHESRPFEQARHTFEPGMGATSTDHTSAPSLDPDLLAQLEDADPQGRADAAELLALDGDAEALDPLLQLLYDPAEVVRAAAAEALGWMRDRQALPALSGALHDPSDLVRAAAARALGRSRDPGALPDLRPLEADPNADVHRAVAEALDTLDPARASAAHAQHLARGSGSGEGTAPRRVFTDQVFRDFSDPYWNFPWLRRRPGRTFANLEFQRCHFEHCILSVTNSPQRRSTIRDIRLIDCDILGCSLDAALVEDVVVDGLETSGLCFSWGTAFRHVTLCGRLGSFKLNLWEHSTAELALQRAFVEANARYYSTVDWALDISEAEFEDIELTSVPGHLVRRDPESQVLVTREKAVAGAWRHLDLSATWWATALDLFLMSGMPSTVLVAPKRHYKYRLLLDGLHRLRDSGVAEPQ